MKFEGVMRMILLKNVSKSYRNGVRALRDINLEINEGEFVYIIGPTGSEKSTLIKILDGEEICSQGEVLVNGISVSKLKYSKVPIYRRNIDVVFQDFRLLLKMAIFENIAFAMKVLALEKNIIRKRVKEILELVDLQDKAKAFSYELSGGQQWATIARAIANHLHVLIADEPTGNLDSDKSKEIIGLLEKINEVGKTTIIIVTHDIHFVNTYKKRTIVLDEGYLMVDIEKGGYIQYG